MCLGEQSTAKSTHGGQVTPKAPQLERDRVRIGARLQRHPSLQECEGFCWAGGKGRLGLNVGGREGRRDYIWVTYYLLSSLLNLY